MIEKLRINEKDYMVRLIEENENEEVFDLFKACPDYFVKLTGEEANEASIESFFYALPPNKEVKDKFSIGIYTSGELVGVVDLIKGYPEDTTWMIGMILVHPKYRRNGLGEGIHTYIQEIAEYEEANLLRIGVVTENNDVLEFWEKLGYEVSRRTEDVIVLECKL